MNKMMKDGKENEMKRNEIFFFSGKFMKNYNVTFSGKLYQR